MKKISNCKTIGIVNLGAPEAANNSDNYNRGLKYLESMGFSLKIASNVLKNDGFTAGLPEEQVSELHKMYQDKSVDAILCVGGGTNANELLPLLDFDLIKSKSKILLGASIVTGILNAIYHYTKCPTFHGPAIIWTFGNEDGIGDYTLTSFKDVLGLPNQHEYSEREDAPDKWQALRYGNSQGVLIGGNLWTLQQLIGTPYEPDWNNKILVLEDCFSQYANIKAMLNQFKQAGIFNKISGLIWGVFLDCEDEYNTGKTLNDILMEVIGDCKFPILANVELGHTSEKLTFPIGSKASLNLSNDNLKFNVQVE
ncbi:peptidase S66 [Bacteroidia bacterium]|nr:peptidase S66 [Bacteroidia bacterium]